MIQDFGSRGGGGYPPLVQPARAMMEGSEDRSLPRRRKGTVLRFELPEVDGSHRLNQLN